MSETIKATHIMKKQNVNRDVQAQTFIERVTRPSKATYDDQVRELMLEQLPATLPQPFVDFIDEMLRDEWIMRGYCTPMLPQGETEFVYPWEQALFAAARAKQLSILRGPEQNLACFLALIEPCARFAVSLPGSVRSLLPDAPSPLHIPTMRETTQLRAAMLETPLRSLSSRGSALADTVSAVLALGRAEQEADADQVARLRSAVTLGTVTLNDYWPLQGHAMQVANRRSGRRGQA